MDNRNAFTRFLAVAGTVLVWLPILAPFFFSAARLISHRMFRLDYLMPASSSPWSLLAEAHCYGRRCGCGRVEA